MKWRIDRSFDLAHREKMLRGFHIIGGRAKVEEAELIGPQKLRLVLRQGIKRQIRLMLYTLGYEVTMLRRIRIGPLRLGRLKPGEWRRLNPKEVAALKSAEPQPPPERMPRGARPAPNSKTRKRPAGTKAGQDRGARAGFSGKSRP